MCRAGLCYPPANQTCVINHAATPWPKRLQQVIAFAKTHYSTESNINPKQEEGQLVKFVVFKTVNRFWVLVTFFVLGLGLLLQAVGIAEWFQSYSG